MQNTILIINGPNLNMLGTREPEIYGSDTLDDIKAMCEKKCESLGYSLIFEQYNAEGDIVDAIQRSVSKVDGIIINAAAYTHTSVAIRDALVFTKLPIIEVHLSNIYKRESFREISYLSDISEAVICGLGSYGYIVSIDAMCNKILIEN